MMAQEHFTPITNTKQFNKGEQIDKLRKRNNF